MELHCTFLLCMPLQPATWTALPPIDHQQQPQQQQQQQQLGAAFFARVLLQPPTPSRSLFRHPSPSPPHSHLYASTQPSIEQRMDSWDNYRELFSGEHQDLLLCSAGRLTTGSSEASAVLTAMTPRSCSQRSRLPHTLAPLPPPRLQSS